MIAVLVACVLGASCVVVLVRSTRDPSPKRALFPIVQSVFVAGYVVFPLMWGKVLGGDDSQFGGITDAYVTESVAIHLAFFVLLIGSYTLATRWWPVRRGSLEFVQSLRQGPLAGLVLLVLVAGLVDVAMFSSGYASELTDNLDDPTRLAAQNLLLLPSRFYYALLAVLLARALERGNRQVAVIVLSGLAASVAVAASGGTRASVFHPMVMGVLAMVVFKRHREALVSVVVVATLLPPASFLLAQFRGLEEGRAQVTVERISGLINVARTGSGAGPVEQLDVLASRGDVVSNAAVMMEYLRESGEYASWKPYIGVPASVIPRVLWPAKPVASSIDGTPRGNLSLIVAQVRYGYRDTGLTAHGPLTMFWQFGWAGVIAGGVACGVLMAWFAGACATGGSAGLVVLLAVLGQAAFGAGPSVDQLLMLLLHLYLPAYLAFRATLATQGLVPLWRRASRLTAGTSR